MYFIRTTQEISWNSQALTEQPDSSLLALFLCWSSRYFWLGHGSRIRRPAHTWPRADYVRGLILTAWICRQRVDRKLVCTRTCLLRAVSMPLWWWHRRVEVRLGGWWGQRQPLGWKLALAMPPWDWRVSHDLFPWLLFASKVQAALVNVAVLIWNPCWEIMGKWKNAYLRVTLQINSLGSTRALRACGAAPM